ncbi:extracellular solute-binding protein [Candidatus Dojkabacteria bacterium]|uniref:Extracellular solute-binding protein n=1 Tax=Candidatus Dojkabacteria bacterium TaxID=2099670 RepID=A0A955RJZ2_9BACT|nr:extracellular solute-binding protein [Candidatus Dojkabacteria bacterium]
MKRIVLSTIILAFFLAGCVSKNEVDPVVVSVPSFEDEGEIQGEDTTKLIMWGMFETDDNMQVLIDAFESENPEIEIEYVKKDKETYASELRQVLQDGNPNTSPDIYMIHNSWVENHLSFIATSPESILSTSDFEDEFHAFVAEDFAFGGSVRGVPLWVDLLGLIYNEEHLIDTGDTVIAEGWDTFIVQALNMTTESSEPPQFGFSAGNSENVEFYFDVMNLLFMQARTQPLTPEDREVLFAEGEQIALEDALLFYRNFLSTNKTWNSSQKLDTASFIEGTTSSFIAPTWRILDILDFKEARNLDMLVRTAQVPQLNLGEDEKVTIATYWGYVVSDDSSNTNSAWEFLRFLTTKETQELYADTVVANGREFALLSPRIDQLTAQSDNVYLQPYVASIPYAMSWHMVNGQKLQEPYAQLLGNEIDFDDLLAIIDELRENSNEL